MVIGVWPGAAWAFKASFLVQLEHGRRAAQQAAGSIDMLERVCHRRHPGGRGFAFSDLNTRQFFRRLGWDGWRGHGGLGKVAMKDTSAGRGPVSTQTHAFPSFLHRHYAE